MVGFQPWLSANFLNLYEISMRYRNLPALEIGVDYTCANGKEIHIDVPLGVLYSGAKPYGVEFKACR